MRSTPNAKKVSQREFEIKIEKIRQHAMITVANAQKSTANQIFWGTAAMQRVAVAMRSADSYLKNRKERKKLF